KCSICRRTFARSDHLQRHQHTHTEDSPFSCPNCHRRFQRLDARNRHTAKFCLQNNASRNKPTAIDRRARVACDGCRTQKLKCSGAHPCAACERRARPCEYSQ
ncbi:hypothetical protein J3E74DRAFT_170521, partial [Bipolaris maydis]